jgi:hypothetical protein
LTGQAAAHDRRMHWRLLAGVSEEDVRRLVSVARRRRFSRAEQSQREPAADDQVQGLDADRPA